MQSYQFLPTDGKNSVWRKGSLMSYSLFDDFGRLVREDLLIDSGGTVQSPPHSRLVSKRISCFSRTCQPSSTIKSAVFVLNAA